MKTCTTCKEEKEDREFFFKNKSTGRRHCVCKSCKRKIDKIHYDRSSLRRHKIRKNANEAIRRAKDFVTRVRKKCCCNSCGEKRYYVLDFHHIRNKKETISCMVKKGAIIKRIKEELRKCIPLCANCHRELHHLEELEKKLTG